MKPASQCRPPVITSNPSPFTFHLSPCRNSSYRSVGWAAPATGRSLPPHYLFPLPDDSAPAAAAATATTVATATAAATADATGCGSARRRPLSPPSP